MSPVTEITPSYELEGATRSYGEGSTLVVALDALYRRASSSAWPSRGMRSPPRPTSTRRPSRCYRRASRALTSPGQTIRRIQWPFRSE